MIPRSVSGRWVYRHQPAKASRDRQVLPPTGPPRGRRFRTAQHSTMYFLSRTAYEKSHFLLLASKAQLQPFSALTITRITPIFSIEAGKGSNSGSGMIVENMGVCKENIFIHPPAPKKSNICRVKSNVQK